MENVDYMKDTLDVFVPFFIELISFVQIDDTMIYYC